MVPHHKQNKVHNNWRLRNIYILLLCFCEIKSMDCAFSKSWNISKGLLFKSEFHFTDRSSRSQEIRIDVTSYSFDHDDLHQYLSPLFMKKIMLNHTLRDIVLKKILNYHEIRINKFFAFYRAHTVHVNKVSECFKLMLSKFLINKWLYFYRIKLIYFIYPAWLSFYWS